MFVRRWKSLWRTSSCFPCKVCHRQHWWKSCYQEVLGKREEVLWCPRWTVIDKCQTSGRDRSRIASSQRHCSGRLRRHVLQQHRQDSHGSSLGGWVLRQEQVLHVCWWRLLCLQSECSGISPQSSQLSWILRDGWMSFPLMRMRTRNK